MARQVRYLIALTLQLALVGQLARLLADAERVVLQVPNSKRSEGRVTLEYYRNNETIKYQLAFNEVIDTDTMRSKVSIGYVSYEPTVYHSRGANILTVDGKTGKCVCLKQVGYKFVPELDWFLRLTHTEEELEQGMPMGKQHHIGPTGIVLMLSRYTKFDHLEMHRNVQCQVTSARYDRKKAKDILYEVLVPDLKMFDGPNMNLFTVRETVKNAVNDAGETFSTTMTIDYYYTEEIDKTSVHQVDKLEMDLNLPFARGCSEFLQVTRPKTATQSFTMAYGQNLAQTVIFLAYDHNAGYLRKEIVGRSVAIWDLNEDLLYHVNQNSDARLTNSVDIEVPLEVCSVLSVKDKRGTSDGGDNSTDYSMILPYKETGRSLDVLEFLGAREIYYLGLATVRDLPCQIFETILGEPPRIFDIDLRVELSDKADTFDYIVQFYIFKTNVNKELERREKFSENGSAANVVRAMVDGQFWPARISLVRRHKETGKTMLYDQLDIDDFHWGLYGYGTKKPSELFMIPECFNDEDEQLRLSLALEFDRLNAIEEDKLLRHSKYKLEKELLDDLFGLLGISRMHLTEFQLSLRSRNVLANLAISDRIDGKSVSYFGAGELPSPTSYLNNRIMLQGLASSDHGAESSCILQAAHVSQVSMAIYCPRLGDSEGPTCTAIFGESQPVVKRPSASKEPPTPQGPFEEAKTCQVYRFEASRAPKAATSSADELKLLLADHKFNFEVDTTPKVTFKGIIQDYDVSREMQLITISNYKYALAANEPEAEATDTKEVEPKAGSSSSNVRTFDTELYNNLGDCAKICDLDVSCKSFSYCQEKALERGKCVLASLDLRQNNVENQLVSARATKNNQIIVRDLEARENQTSEYLLDLKSNCKIYEKNFLSSYTQTEEVLRIESGIALHFLTTSSAAECARWVQSLEEQNAELHCAMFAYCTNTNTCLIDEDLFVSITSSTKQRDEDEADQPGLSNDMPSDMRELSCQIYRKRYQTYFHVSPKVLKHSGDAGSAAADWWGLNANPIKQIRLQLNTVEQCARACWDSFGHSCLSFDFCTPQECLLNLLNDASKTSRADFEANLKYETRLSCLHYERDLKWDQLRRDHLIGHHVPLGLMSPENNSSSAFANVAGNIFLLAVTSVLFVVGLAVGRIFNDRLENVGIMRRSLLTESVRSRGGTGGGLNFGFASNSPISRPAQRGASSVRFSNENEIYEDPDAICLEDFGKKRDANADELDKSSDEASTASAVRPSDAVAGTGSNHIDVPNLISV